MNALRSFLYWLARFLGDVQAGRQAIRKGSIAPIAKRVGRRAAGKIAGRSIGRMFPPTR